MKKITPHLLTFALISITAVAQTPAYQTPASNSSSTSAPANANTSDKGQDSSFRVAEGSVFHVVLAKNVDAKKNKVGDEVTTTTVEDLKSNGQVIVPKNSRVIGHITQIQAHSKDNPKSQIAIVFDRLVIKDRPEVPLPASIQAVAAPETAPSDEQSGTGYGETGGSMAGSGGRGGYPSGAGGRTASGGVAGTAASAESSVGRVAGQGSGNSIRLSAASQGVLGLKGLSLSTQEEASQGAIISSDQQNVHLEHGTQFVLRVKAK